MFAEPDLIDFLGNSDSDSDNPSPPKKKTLFIKKKRKRPMSSINLGELQKLKYALRIINEKIDDDSLSIEDLDDLLHATTKLREKIRQITDGRGRSKYKGKKKKKDKKKKKKDKKKTKKRTTK